MNFLPKTVYRIEDIEIDALQHCVRRKGRERYVRPQAFQTLLYLVGQRGRVVSKDGLIAAIWNNAAVTDSSLVRCIADIRKALGDDPREPRFIKTIHRTGYRFVGAVREDLRVPECDGEAVAPPAAEAPLADSPLAAPLARAPREGKPPVWLAVSAVLLAAGAVTAALAMRDERAATPRKLGEAMTANLEAYRLYSLGVEKSEAFENTEAIALFERAVALDPGFAMAHARIGYAYAVTGLVPEKGRSYLEKAFAQKDRLTARDRSYITAWYAIAQADYPQAVKAFRKIIEVYPFDMQAYYRLAKLLSGEERLPEAIAVVRKGLALDPDAKELYNLLRCLLIHSGEAEESLAAGRRYLELAPNEPNAHDSMAEAYQRFGRYDEALSEYEKALAQNPRFEPSVLQLADVYFQQGRYQKAIDQYHRFAAVASSDVDRAVAHGNIAHVYFMKGDLARAERAAALEMSLAPGGTWHAVEIALERRDLRRARSLVPRLTGDSPYRQRGARPSRRADEYFRGYLALKSGHADEAILRFQAAIRHLPQGAGSGIDVYEDCLANAYFELGRMDEAISEYERVLQLNPSYPLAHYRLARAWAAKGDHARARHEYHRFLDVWRDADADIPEVVDARRRVG